MWFGVVYFRIYFLICRLIDKFDMNMKKSGAHGRRRLGLGAVFIFLTVTSIAQNLSQHNWYFGNTTSGIKFNRGNNKASMVTNQALPFGTGGAAVATDPATGNLLFYSDGTRVYDGCHLPMLNGAGLNGNSSANQPVAISPIPGQPDKYFLFTNSANFTTGGSISRSIVDLTLFGNSVFPAPPFGDVQNPKNVPIGSIPANRSEAMITIPHANGIDFWLVTHEVSSNRYSSTLINAGSFTGTFTTGAPSSVGLPISAANFAYHANSKKLAVAPQTASDDALILNFNDATGALTFDRTILNSATTSTGQSIYDIEWDRRGRFLYLSVAGSVAPPVVADVLQYDYLNPTITLVSVLPSPRPTQSFGLQTGPDTTMYHIYQTGANLRVGSLLKTDSVASKVVYNATPFGTTNFAGTQFPSFLPKANVNLTVTFTSIGTCENSPTSFFPDVKPGADSLRWDFGDTNRSNGWSPVHTYAQPQTYNVSLTAFYQGQTQSVTQPVTITAFPLQLQLVQDTTICKCEFPNPYNPGTVCPPGPAMVPVKASGGVGALSYQWSNETAPTNNMLKPAKPGYYYVVVTDAGTPGCSAYAGVNVKEYGLQDQRANIWYFGNKAGIDFNVQPPVALNTSAMDAPEGCAIICDRNGNAIFYTDGDKVYDKTNTLIDSGIGGDPLSSQSSLIVPVTGDETLYYIFTTQAISGTSLNQLKYSLFDLKQNSGNGAVVKKDILLFAKSTERIAANGQWLIAHEYGNSTFRAYPISAAGIGEPVYSSIGSDHTFKSQTNGEGYMKLGPRDNLAVALSTPGTSNLVELFHLNDTTGVVNDYRKIDLKEPAGQVYGLEFSPGGNKLFATLKGTPSPSTIFEYSIDSIEKPHFKQKISQPAELGAIQLAPDGQIYLAINGSNILGSIQANEDTTRLSSYNASGFTLAGATNSRLGLPNFVQQISNAFGGPSISVAGTCAGDSTRFTGTATDAIDNFFWTFGDGGTSTLPNPSHLYATAGTYTVALRLTNRCGLDTQLSQKVTIFNPPPRPTVPGAIALCTGVVTLDANTANLPNTTYLWSNGQTTKTLTFTEPAFVSVTNTDVNGCTSTAQSIVADNRPQVDLGPDLTICQNNSTPNLNAQNPGTTYAWQINGVNSGASQTQAVSTSATGVFTYSVTVTDPITTCTATDQKVYTINVSPSFTMSGIDPTGACGSATGTIRIQLNASAPPAGPYTYSLFGPSGSLTNPPVIDQTAPSPVVSFTSQVAGTFSGIVTDQISGCTISQTFGLSDAAAFTANATPVTNCDPIAFNINSTGAPTITYVVTNGATGQSITNTSATANFTTTPTIGVQSGTTSAFTIQLTDNLGCIRTLNQNVVPANPVPVTITPNLCVTPPTVTASGATSYTWSSNIAGGIVGPTTGATIQLQANVGTITLTNVATAAATCPNTQNITIDVANAITPTFTQSDACSSSIILTASPAGPFTYRWYKGGVFQSTLLGRQISLGLSENGASYAVETFNTLNGCAIRSTPVTVSVVGPISASLTSTPACDDNKPFTLTAASVATGVSYAWFFNNSTTPIAGATAATLNQTAAGTYKVEISKATCKATTSIQITKAPIPVGTLPPRAIICDDPDNNDPTTSQIDLNPGAFNNYVWFKNDLSLNYTRQILTADTKGIYRVDLTNAFGCVASDQTEVRNDCFPKITGPNAFRPTSGQGTNKEFFVYSFFITDQFEVFIYNRWGELVFQSNDRNFRWNGNYNNTGAPLPGGTYVYIVKYTSSFRPEKGVQEQRGGVVLLR